MVGAWLARWPGSETQAQGGCASKIRGGRVRPLASQQSSIKPQDHPTVMPCWERGGKGIFDAEVFTLITFQTTKIYFLGPSLSVYPLLFPYKIEVQPTTLVAIASFVFDLFLYVPRTVSSVHPRICRLKITNSWQSVIFKVSSYENLFAFSSDSDPLTVLPC